jgi:hypothetical protein
MLQVRLALACQAEAAGVRFSSRTPSLLSSVASRLVAAGGVRSTARAAAARLPSRAISTKRCMSEVRSFFTFFHF